MLKLWHLFTVEASKSWVLENAQLVGHY
jgi:hypothetical protein